MIPIKYRQKILKPSVEQFFHFWGYLEGLEGGFTSPENNKHKSEQSTNLLDKGGIELYVGDIVECRIEGWKIFKGQIYQLGGGGFAFCGLSLINRIHMVKKLGNIHQNKKLLEEIA